MYNFPFYLRIPPNNLSKHPQLIKENIMINSNYIIFFATLSRKFKTISSKEHQTCAHQCDALFGKGNTTFRFFLELFYVYLGRNCHFKNELCQFLGPN